MGVFGLTDNLKKGIKKQLKALEKKCFPRHLLVSPELAQGLASLTHVIGKEIAVYLDRHGRIREIMIGDSETVPLIKDQMRRSNERLSGVRCIHTHPSGSSYLSRPDITSMLEFNLDAMVAIGTTGGKITDIQAAFPLPHSKYSNRQEKNYRLFGPLKVQEIEDFPFLNILLCTDKEIIKPAAYDIKKMRQKALLIGFKKNKSNLLTSEESLRELEELAGTAGVEVTGKLVLNMEKPDPALYISRGKVREITLYRQQESLDLLIFDDELLPRQESNLQEAIGCSIVDRTALILQIFADRARTREGILQVELAQLNYLLPRLTGYGTGLSRLGGGIGTRGPGETKLETDRRRIHKRINDLQKEIEEIKKQRNVIRKHRHANHVPVVAIVGYTNAGKSTLMNTLTKANVLAENRLFATLDPTTRRIKSIQGEILLTDTVGFIHKLPHQLIAAFRATLEEIKYADLLLQVVDASNPAFEAHIQSVDSVLKEIGVVEKPIITVFNKWDCIKDIYDTIEMQNIINRYKPSLSISALTGYNINNLLELINETLPNRPQLVKLLIPFSHATVLNNLYKYGEVINTEYLEDGILCIANLDNPWLNKMKQYFYVKE